jgi:hypothetical protein
MDINDCVAEVTPSTDHTIESVKEEKRCTNCRKSDPIKHKMKPKSARKKPTAGLSEYLNESFEGKIEFKKRKRAKIDRKRKSNINKFEKSINNK